MTDDPSQPKFFSIDKIQTAEILAALEGWADAMEEDDEQGATVRGLIQAYRKNPQAEVFDQLVAHLLESPQIVLFTETYPGLLSVLRWVSGKWPVRRMVQQAITIAARLRNLDNERLVWAGHFARDHAGLWLSAPLLRTTFRLLEADVDGRWMTQPRDGIWASQAGKKTTLEAYVAGLAKDFAGDDAVQGWIRSSRYLLALPAIRIPNGQLKTWDNVSDLDRALASHASSVVTYGAISIPAKPLEPWSGSLTQTVAAWTEQRSTWGMSRRCDDRLGWDPLRIEIANAARSQPAVPPVHAWLEARINATVQSRTWEGVRPWNPGRGDPQVHIRRHQGITSMEAAGFMAMLTQWGLLPEIYGHPPKYRPYPLVWALDAGLLDVLPGIRCWSDQGQVVIGWGQTPEPMPIKELRLVLAGSSTVP